VAGVVEDKITSRMPPQRSMALKGTGAQEKIWPKKKNRSTYSNTKKREDKEDRGTTTAYPGRRLAKSGSREDRTRSVVQKTTRGKVYDTKEGKSFSMSIKNFLTEEGRKPPYRCLSATAVRPNHDKKKKHIRERKRAARTRSGGGSAAALIEIRSRRAEGFRFVAES